MEQKINETYIRKTFGTDLSQEDVGVLKGVMQKYEGNYWWESKDPAEIAKYQLFEEVLMVDFSTFLKGVEELVGRTVYAHELGSNLDRIREESQEAIARMEGKTGSLDDKVARERELFGIKVLTDYTTKTDKPLIGLVLPNYKE
ncbi:MAG: hypothetical protein ACMXX8_00675 [Candidatus Woesearchaeota archaeon]